MGMPLWPFIPQRLYKHAQIMHSTCGHAQFQVPLDLGHPTGHSYLFWVTRPLFVHQSINRCSSKVQLLDHQPSLSNPPSPLVYNMFPPSTVSAIQAICLTFLLLTNPCIQPPNKKVIEFCVFPLLPKNISDNI
jgi:hypothetical protein